MVTPLTISDLIRLLVEDEKYILILDKNGATLYAREEFNQGIHNPLAIVPYENFVEFPNLVSGSIGVACKGEEDHAESG